MRHAADAILVGLGTVLQDDPLLTTRLPQGQGVNPLRIVVDSDLQLPLTAQLASVTSDCRTLVATTERAPTSKQLQLEALGVEILRLPAYDEQVDVEALFRMLGIRGIASVLVEGGAVLSATLLRRHLVDKMTLFMAPKIIGGDGISVVAACGVETMAQAIQLRDLTSRSVGEDLMLTGYLATPSQSAGRFPSQTEEA